MTAAAPRVAGLTTRHWRVVLVVGVLVLACVLPFLVSNYRTFQLTMMLVYAIALLGLNLLTGYNGQISLGHGAWFALGAYTTAIMIDQWGIPYYWTLPVAAAVCLVVGFLFGVPALRLRGHYLALATLALALVIPQLLKYQPLQPFTGGVQGILILKPEVPWGLPINQDQWLYFFVLAITLVMFVLGWNLIRGRVGRALVAIRDHEVAAETMGVNNALYKSTVFGVSALYTGVAGALSAVVVQFVAPDSYNILVSITLLVGIVVGGLASISGAIFGAAFIQFIPQVAESVSKAAPWAIYGVFLILLMFVMPTGIAGFIKWVSYRFLGTRGGD